MTLRRIARQEPSIAAVLARLDLDLRLVGFREEQNYRIENPFIADLKMKPFVRAEVRHDAQFRFFDPGLLFQLAKRGVDRPFARLEMSLREIPITAAAIQQ